MVKLAFLVAALIITIAIVLACTLGGFTEGFRYFIVMAGIVLGVFAACGIVEARAG